jgi:hypothetical protein
MSSTEIPVVNPEPLSLKKVGELLVKHYGLHEGMWDVAIEIQAAIGQFGFPPTDVMPGAMFRISRIGLTKANQAGHMTVNAAELNPAPLPA